MDWTTHVAALLKDTEKNLSRLHGQRIGSYGVTGKKVPHSFALLRQGVSPGDPHLIAPAPGGINHPNSEQLIPTFYPDAAPPLEPPSQKQLAEVESLKAELRGVHEELAQLRQSAAGWQQLAAAVTGVDSRCASTANQLVLLGNRLDALSSNGSSSPACVMQAALAPLTSRLQQAEQGRHALQIRVEQNAATAGEAAAGTRSTLEADVQDALQSLQSRQSSSAQRQEAQARDLKRIDTALRAVQATVTAATEQHAAQLAELSSRQAEHEASGRACQQHDSQIERLSSQVAAVQAAQGAQSSSLQQQASQIEQMEAQLAELMARSQEPQPPDAAGASRQAFRQLPDQVQSSASAIEQLQAQVAQVAAVQEAVDDVNHRLFELRVEVQNAAEDASIATASTKRRAESAEQSAAEAVDAVADVRHLAVELQQQVEQMRQETRSQIAVLQGEVAGSKTGGEEQPADGALAQTVEELAAELVNLKLTMAQQQEAAEDAAAASRAEAACHQELLASMQSTLAVLGKRVGKLAPDQAALDNVQETADCLTDLTAIVHKQQDELVKLKQAVVAAQAAATAATEAIASGAADAGRLQTLQTETTADFKAAIAKLEEQLVAAVAASGQQPAEQQHKLATLQRNLAAVQAAASEIVTLQQSVPSMQLKLAALEGGIEAKLGECQRALAALQQRLAELEEWQQRADQTNGRGASGNTTNVDASEGVSMASSLARQEVMSAVQARIERLEAGLAGGSSAGAPALEEQQQPQQAFEALEALQQQMAGLQQQLAGLQQQLEAVAATQQQEANQGLPPKLQSEVDARLQRTEVTVAHALEEVAAQMHALMERMDQVEATSVASAAHAQAAAAVAQQQVAEMRGMLTEACNQTSNQEPAQQRSVERNGDSVRPSFQQASLPRSASVEHQNKRQQPSLRQPPWQPPSACPSAASSSRRSSLQRSSSSSSHLLSQSASQHEEIPPPKPALAKQGSSSNNSSSSGGRGGGLFARLSRSFTSQRRSSGTTIVSQPTPPPVSTSNATAAATAILDAAAMDSATSAPASGLEENKAVEVPLRVRYSTSLEQEHSALEEQLSSQPSSLSCASPSHSPQCSRRARSVASGTATPRRQSSGALTGSGSGDGDEKHITRSRQLASSQGAAGLEQEHGSGSGSGRARPGQGGSAVGTDSSFGNIPLLHDGSYLISSREAVGESIRQLENELADPEMDEVQREVLESDLRRLIKERAAIDKGGKAA